MRCTACRSNRGAPASTPSCDGCKMLGSGNTGSVMSEGSAERDAAGRRRVRRLLARRRSCSGGGGRRGGAPATAAPSRCPCSCRRCNRDGQATGRVLPKCVEAMGGDRAWQGWTSDLANVRRALRRLPQATWLLCQQPDAPISAQRSRDQEKGAALGAQRSGGGEHALQRVWEPLHRIDEQDPLLRPFSMPLHIASVARLQALSFATATV